MKSQEEVKWLDLLKKPARTEEEKSKRQLAGEAFIKQLTKEMESLKEDLLKAGSKFSDPWDMVNSKKAYPEAIDVLIKHLSKPYHDKNKEGIIRALAVKEAKGKATKPLIDEFHKLSSADSFLKWVIGNTMVTVIDNSVVEDVLDIIHDRSNGHARQMFVISLARLKLDETLINLLNEDEEVIIYALQALSKLKSVKALTRVKELSYYSSIKVKKEALKTLKKISI